MVLMVIVRVVALGYISIVIVALTVLDYLLGKFPNYYYYNQDIDRIMRPVMMIMR